MYKTALTCSTIPSKTYTNSQTRHSQSSWNPPNRRTLQILLPMKDSLIHDLENHNQNLNHSKPEQTKFLNQIMRTVRSEPSKQPPAHQTPPFETIDPIILFIHRSALSVITTHFPIFYTDEVDRSNGNPIQINKCIIFFHSRSGPSISNPDGYDRI